MIQRKPSKHTWEWEKNRNYHLKCALNSVCVVNIRFILLFFRHPTRHISLSLLISWFLIFNVASLAVCFYSFEFFFPLFCSVNSSVSMLFQYEIHFWFLIFILREKDWNRSRKNGREGDKSIWLLLILLAIVDAIQVIPWMPFALITILRFIFFYLLCFFLFMSCSPFRILHEAEQSRRAQVFFQTRTHREKER